MRIVHVVGARPNFMKLAPVWSALSQHTVVKQTLVHTGQHYDRGMSEVFFQQLEIPAPDHNLGVGSGTHAEQTARIMTLLEPHLLQLKPDMTLVYGDVNSTIAAALVCAKERIAVGHVEAGLRSFDRSMPEEINRILTDQMSDLLFTPSQDGNENLAREGIPRGKIHLVGNTMIDTLVRALPQAKALWSDGLAARYGESPYLLVTLHRPSNVDDPDSFARILRALEFIGRQIRVLFPVHPRTRQHIRDLSQELRSVELLEPLGYLEFLALQTRAVAVVTDSGGIQEETTFLGVPCLTVRSNTERPAHSYARNQHSRGRRSRAHADGSAASPRREQKAPKRSTTLGWMRGAADCANRPGMGCGKSREIARA